MQARGAVIAEAAVVGVALLGACKADIGAVLLADVPVELQQVVLHAQLGGVVQVAGFKFVLVGGDGLEGIDGRLRNGHVGQRRAGRAEFGLRAVALQFFITRKKEQLVLNDRSTQRGANRGLAEGQEFKVAVCRAVVALAHAVLVAPDI